MIKCKIILPHIYLLTFKTQYELCMSFVRMQEFYESPKFRGKYFTLEEYIDYWCKEFGNGSFTYPSVWNGFNLPSSVFENWRKRFQDVRCKESVILSKVDSLIGEEEWNKEDKKYYIIAVNEENKEKMESAIKHEIAHALYYLYPDYKKSCDKLLRTITKKKLRNDKKILFKMGYCRATINDELQAYYSNPSDVIDASPEFIVNMNSFKKRLTKNK